MDYLRDMGLFVEVARARSFRQAAAALSMPSSTLSRRILALEKVIGLRLLHRTTRRIELTEAGQIYFERSKRIIDDARLAHEQLGEIVSNPSGVLRVSLPVDFATVFLAPILPGFRLRYPGISLELDLTPRRADLVAEPFDLAIRMGDLPDSQLIARKIAEVPRHLYASPEYLNVRGEPVEPDDLTCHDCLLFPEEKAWTLRRNGTAHRIAVSGEIHLNNVGMMQRLAVEGLGVAMLARESAEDDLAAGRLRHVLPLWQGKPISVHAITETRLLPAKTQRFIEHLKEHMGHSA